MLSLITGRVKTKIFGAVLISRGLSLFERIFSKRVKRQQEDKHKQIAQSLSEYAKKVHPEVNFETDFSFLKERG